MRLGTFIVEAGEGQRTSSIGSSSACSASPATPGKAMAGTGDERSLVDRVREAVLRIELARERSDPTPRSEP